MSVYELIGLLGSVFVFISICFKSDNIIGNLKLRTLNAIGSFIFIIYGFLLPAYATAILNIACLGVNVYYLILLVKDFKAQTEKY